MRGESEPQAERITVGQLLAEARACLNRISPAAAQRAVSCGKALLIDVRSETQRRRDGELPGANRVPRNVLEWRLDPASDHCDRELARPDVPLVIMCDEGYQSSLAAATLRRFGINATDVVGGFQAWRAAGLPVERAA